MILVVDSIPSLIALVLPLLLVCSLLIWLRLMAIAQEAREERGDSGTRRLSVP